MTQGSVPEGQQELIREGVSETWSNVWGGSGLSGSRDEFRVENLTPNPPKGPGS